MKQIVSIIFLDDDLELSFLKAKFLNQEYRKQIVSIIYLGDDLELSFLKAKFLNQG